jgi:putative alpha-1,2-mannosidase
MIGLSTTEVVIALAALAMITLAFAAFFTRKPKRAEKWEKAEIVKQLLALSEQESSSRFPAPAARPVARSSQSRLKTTTKATLPARAKAR